MATSADGRSATISAYGPLPPGWTGSGLVEESVAAGVELVKREGLLVRQVVIPQLHEQMREKIL